MTRTAPILSLITASLLFSAAAFAAEGSKPRMRDGGQFASLSGFEGREAALGAAIAEAIRNLDKANTPALDFTGREAVLGNGVATVIRTMNVREPYQHEMNDALVKMTLTFLQFAKDNNLLDEMLDHEVRTQMPMLMRVGNLVRDTGKTEFALIAMTDRTACFYQLAMEVQREPGTIRFRNPFTTVLEVSRKLGQHDMTEEEIHNLYIRPGFERKAELMGVRAIVSDYRADGWISLSIAPLEPKVAAAQ